MKFETCPLYSWDLKCGSNLFHFQFTVVVRMFVCIIWFEYKYYSNSSFLVTPLFHQFHYLPYKWRISLNGVFQLERLHSMLRIFHWILKINYLFSQLYMKRNKLRTFNVFGMSFWRIKNKYIFSNKAVLPLYDWLHIMFLLCRLMGSVKKVNDDT